MSGKNKHKSNRVPEYIRYRHGNMTGKEKNSFERELQKDPFSEEAAEGFDMLSSEELGRDMDTLSRRLKRRVTGKRRILAYRIAASIAVLMVISSVFLVIERNRQTKNMPAEISEQRTFAIPAGQAIKSKGKGTLQRPVTPSATGKKSNIAATRKNTPEKATGYAAMEAEEVPAAEMQAKAPVENITTDKSKRVIHTAEAIAARADSGKKAKFQPDAASLNEAVVVGYGTRKSSATPKGYNPPIPVAGRKAFDKYINDNIIRPDTLNDKKRVVVVLSFRVGADGTVDSIRIVRSPGNQFSGEAIRLLKSGPAWKPATEDGKSVNDVVTIGIVFRNK